MDWQSLKPKRDRTLPIYLQLYQRYRDAIATGQLQPGDRVPSARSLASELNLARGTVEQAYQMLTGEGYLLARGPAGTVVSPRLAEQPDARYATTSRLPTQAPSHPPVALAEPLPFQLGLPALDAFPRKTWARLAGRNARSTDAATLVYPDPEGYRPLRQAIAAYVGISRGIACHYQQVFVTPGYHGALALMCHALLQPGASGWFEDPGYWLARQFLTQAGMNLTPIPVDDEGLRVDEGWRLAADARFAVVTPSHQSPSGAALSLPRRLALLEWASRRQSWILEDDYDSEFRYHGRPLPALKSLDRDGRVLYSGTFSKVLFPGLRLAYLVVPEPQIARFQAAARLLPGPGGIATQAAVADFMDQGHFARHLRKMRSLYAARRGYLVDALEQTFASRYRIQPQAGGMHVLAYLNAGQNDRALAAMAQTRGLAVQALSDWRMREAAQGGLLMGFTNLADPAQAAALVSQLLAAFDSE